MVCCYHKPIIDVGQDVSDAVQSGIKRPSRRCMEQVCPGDRQLAVEKAKKHSDHYQALLAQISRLSGRRCNSNVFIEDGSGLRQTEKKSKEVRRRGAVLGTGAHGKRQTGREQSLNLCLFIKQRQTML